MKSKQMHAQRFRSAVTRVFCDPAAEVAARLSEFSEHIWQQNLFWLDASGLALYLIDRLATLGLTDVLPDAILARLQQNLADNRQRTDTLFNEVVAINRSLHKKSIRFANLKGITLSPHSVPEPALRCQADLDFLIAEADAPVARESLEDAGYSLKAISGSTWEFWAGAFAVPSMDDHYKARPQRAAELHLSAASDKRLERAQLRQFRGVAMPALSAADLFLFQTLHLFKHISHDLARFGWVLEYWRHVLARRDDPAFWREVKELAQGDPRASVAIGAVTLLATKFFGSFAPDALCSWTVGNLLPPVRLWIEIYGRRAVLSDFPGNKLYLLLQPELDANPEVSFEANKAARQRRLIPLRLPPAITRGQPGERISVRLTRYRVEVSYILFRLRFHAVEGIRYAIEASRWRRRMANLLAENDAGNAAANAERIASVSRPKANVLGVCIDALDMEGAIARITRSLATGERGYVCMANVHSVMEAHRDASLARVYAEAALIVPDGMPTVWVGHMQGHPHMQRVAGPDLMLEVFQRKQFESYSHFLCGGKENVVGDLREELQRRFPWTRIVGTYTPPFRSLSPSEEREFIATVQQAKPDILWVGISTPMQDRFMHRYLSKLDTRLMFGVGAAFDFHTGRIEDCADWIKRMGLQWLDRLRQDPRRLWRRYLRNNPAFLLHIFMQFIRSRITRIQASPAASIPAVERNQLQKSDNPLTGA